MIAIVTSWNDVCCFENELHGKRGDTTGSSPENEDSLRNYQTNDKSPEFSELISCYFLTSTFHCSILLTCSKAMVSSFVNLNMVSNRKKEQQNKSLSSHINELDADFMTGQGNHEAQTESRANMVDKGISLNNLNGSIQVISPQVDVHTI